MKLFHLITSAFALRLVGAYLVSPPGTAAPGSSADCSEWVQQSYGITCAIIEEYFGLTEAQFEAWINYSIMSTLPTAPQTSTVSSTSSTSSSTTTTTTSTSSLCTGVAIASPTPPGAICNVQADSVALTGAGTLTAYGSGTPYVASIQACAAACIAAPTCTNIYFVAGSHCNLHYGPKSYVLNTNGYNSYSFYEVSCFVNLAMASPTPPGAICDVQADSVALTGAGTLTAYGSGTPYVASIQACAAACIATSNCTNVYFVTGSHCNLHYGPTSYVLNTNGYNAYSLYEASCFTNINIASPAPSGAICNVQATSVALTGAGTLTAYNAGSPYVESIQACAAQCNAAPTCTNIYFIAGTHCNLHYGPSSYSLHGGAGTYSFYEASCFTCAIDTPTTTIGNGITTPTPHQTAMAINCNNFYLVVSGDQCGAIASAAGISLAQFYAWNPAVGSTCGYLGLGDYVCIGVVGVTPTTTSSGNGVSTPTPYQAGMTTNCNKFHLVVSGDQCGTVATNAGITLANFYAWNPAVGSTCASLGLGDYVCVGIL